MCWRFQRGVKKTPKSHEELSVIAAQGLRMASENSWRAPFMALRRNPRQGPQKFLFAPFFKRKELGSIMTTKTFFMSPFWPPCDCGPWKKLLGVSLPVSGPNVCSCYVVSCHFRARPAANLFWAVIFIRQLALRVPIPFSPRQNFQKQKQKNIWMR